MDFKIGQRLVRVPITLCIMERYRKPACRLRHDIHLNSSPRPHVNEQVVPVQMDLRRLV